MADIRKYKPDEGDGLAKLVRDALGENIRPNEPGKNRDSQGDEADSAQDDQGSDEPRASSLPNWPSDGPAFTF